MFSVFNLSCSTPKPYHALKNIIFSFTNTSFNYSPLKSFLYVSASSTVQGYVHLLSEVKTASNTTTKYFDLKIQTSENEAVRAVCFSPEKRLTLQQSQQKRAPVKIIGAQLSPSKRFSSSTEEYTIPKKSKISTTNLQFPFKESFSNRFHTVNQVLDANPYETVDLKVKVLTKTENKQPIVQGEKTRYKADCIVADETNSVKLVLWEETIDKVNTGKSYNIENCKIRVFDDVKFVNTNEFTKITDISDVTNVNLATPELHDYLLTGKCIGADINQHYSCILCTKKIDESSFTEDSVTCPNCQITTLVSLLKTKLVCQLLMKIGDKMVTYTAFNDAIQSFLTNIKCDTALQDIDPKVLTLQLIKAGDQNMIADKSTKIISQFLPL